MTPTESSSFTRWPIREIVECGDAVRLGPHAHCARPGDMAVAQFDIGLAIEHDPDSSALKLRAQRVPPIAGHPGVDVLDRLSAAVPRGAERAVGFQVIRA